MSKRKLDPYTLRQVEKRLGEVRYASALLIESALLRQDYAAAANYHAKGEAFVAIDADVRKLLAQMLESATRKKAAK